MDVLSRVHDRGFWFRLIALILSLTIQVLWIALDQLPFFEGSQTLLFLHTVPPYTIFLTLFSIEVFLEPIHPLVHRIFMLLGLCLFAVCGCIGIVNIMAFDRFIALDLAITSLCCVNAGLLTADLIHLEAVHPLERSDPTEKYDWVEVINQANAIVDDDDFIPDPHTDDEDSNTTEKSESRVSVVRFSTA